MKTVSLFFGVLLLTVLVGMPNTASAKSTSSIWSSPKSGLPLAYLGKSSFLSSNTWRSVLLAPITTTIKRKVLAKKNGKLINNRATVSVGDTISFTAPIANTDLPWSSSAFSTQTRGNGVWIKNAASPSRSIYFGSSPYTFSFTNNCRNSRGSSNNCGGSSSSYYGSVSFSVNPSSVAYTHRGSTAGLSCKSTGLTSSSCKVTSGGSIKTQVKYGATYGKFYYYASTKSTSGGFINYTQTTLLSKGKIPLKLCLGSYSCAGSFNYPDYKVTIPPQQIQLTFTAKPKVVNTSTPTPPTPPTTPTPTPPTTPVTAAPVSCSVALAPPTGTLTATSNSFPYTPNSVPYSGNVKLTWTSAHATSCTLTGPSGTLSTSLNGTKVISNLKAATTFNYQCSNAGGSFSKSQPVTIKRTIPPTVTFTAPSSVPYNGKATLTWRSTNATSCALTRTSGTLSPSLKTSAATPSSTVKSGTTNSLTSPTRFTYTCSNVGGSSSQSQNVIVRQPVSCVASSATWSQNGNSCSSSYSIITSNSSSRVTSNANNGSLGSVTLSCVNGVVSQLSPTCTPPSPTVTFTAPNTVRTNKPITLRWNSPNATSCTAVGTTFSTGSSSSTSGSATVFQSGTGTFRYQISCANSGSQATLATATVTVINPSIQSFTVSPSRVLSHGYATATWAATDVASCRITSSNGTSQDITTGNTTGNLSRGSNRLNSITTQTTYKLLCTGNAGPPVSSQSVTVNVVPTIQSF